MKYKFNQNVIRIRRSKSNFYVWIHDITTYNLIQYDERFVFEDRSKIMDMV